VRWVAWVISVLIAWRWLGFLVGLTRLRQFQGSARREARRTVIARGAWNVFFSVAVVYLWASIYDRQPGEALVGFLAAAMLCSLAIGIIAGFMQPEERTPATLDVCAIFRPSGNRAPDEVSTPERDNRGNS
jgi:hypothetical protein